MAAASADEQGKEQAEALVTDFGSGPSRAANPGMVHLPPSPVPQPRYRDDPGAPRDGSNDNSDAGQGRHRRGRRIDFRLSIVAFLRVANVAWSVTNIALIIGMNPRFTAIVLLLVLMWFVLLWNVLNLLPDCLRCSGHRGGFMFPALACVVGICKFSCSPPEDGGDDHEDGDDPMDPPRKKPVDFTWLVDLVYAVLVLVAIILAAEHMQPWKRWFSHAERDSVVAMSSLVM